MKKMFALSLLLCMSILLIGSTSALAVPLQTLRSYDAPDVVFQTATIQFGGSLGLVYSPKDVLISPGGHVIWEGDFVMHPLVSDNALWTTVSSGSQFEFIFNTPGVYHFHCLIHGTLFGMAGTVTVGHQEFVPKVNQ